jgi:hypothetical protein
MNEHEYSAYLNRLYSLVYVELAQKVAAMEFFVRNSDLVKRDMAAGLIEPVLPAIISGLHYDVTFSLYRLFDKRNSARNIFDFLNKTDHIYDDISWKLPFPKDKITSHRLLLDGLSDPIGRLAKRRNKFFAHYDGRYFDDRTLLDTDFPFGVDDACTLLDALVEIVLFYGSAYDGIHSVRNWQIVVYSSTERLYNRIREQPSMDAPNQGDASRTS